MDALAPGMKCCVDAGESGSLDEPDKPAPDSVSTTAGRGILGAAAVVSCCSAVWVCLVLPVHQVAAPLWLAA
ncbi:UNVERIFIED_CONTAM: hypothetical protein Sradi_0142600 [Sesamum radiatum]|uniref:Uncharacterized protein n=1 Tax=Sesamum radiatum TaxID=300843 RepID=A0AAW2WNG3_SESRA